MVPCHNSKLLKHPSQTNKTRQFDPLKRSRIHQNFYGHTDSNLPIVRTPPTIRTMLLISFYFCVNYIYAKSQFLEIISIHPSDIQDVNIRTWVVTCWIFKTIAFFSAFLPFAPALGWLMVLWSTWQLPAVRALQQPAFPHLRMP